MEAKQTPQAGGLLPGLLDYNVLSQMSDQQLKELFGLRDFFTQELDFAAVAAGDTPSASFTVQNDANFLWQMGAFVADISGAAQTDSSRVLPLVSCIIKDQSSGRDLMQNPVPITSLFGDGSLPFILPTPRFFQANTQVTLNLLNFSNATTYNLKLQFIGTKFFKFAQQL